MATLDLQVGAGADDAQENDTGTAFSGTFTTLSAASAAAAGSRYNSGMRFTGVTIQGTTINVAYLAIHAYSTSTDDPNVDILAEGVDDAANFVTTADVTSRVRTTASVQWTATGIGAGEVNSPSIVAVVQELADRAGFANSAAVLFMDGKDDVSRSFFTDAYEGSTTEAAKLHIEYTAGGGGTAVPVFDHHYRMLRAA